jgi:hypothetical protein
VEEEEVYDDEHEFIKKKTLSDSGIHKYNMLFSSISKYLMTKL